jgi:hypothetical protein
VGIVVEADHTPPLDLVDDGDLRLGVPGLGLHVHPFHGMERFVFAGTRLTHARRHRASLPGALALIGLPALGPANGVY